MMESYKKVNTYINVEQNASPISSNNNIQPDKCRVINEKMSN